MQMPPMPEDQLDTIEAPIKFPPLSDLKENTVQVPYSKIPLKSAVAINLVDAGDEGGSGYRQAYASVREVLQKEFLRKGLRVLDQNQLNATLLEMATDKSCDDKQLWWHCTTLLKSEEILMLDQLRASAQNGEIDPGKYSQEIGRIRAIWEGRATATPRLLAAARSGGIPVDYIFEIRTFRPNRVVKQSIALNKSAELRSFIKDYPDLVTQFSEQGRFKCAGMGAEIKARLIDTKSSEVVWIGQHALSEMDLPESQFQIEMGIKRHVVNADEVLDAVEAYNSAKGSKERDGIRVPGWRYDTVLVGPNLILGTCNLDSRPTDELLSSGIRIASEVARALVGTIRTQSAEFPPESDISRPGTGGFDIKTDNKTINGRPKSNAVDFYENSVGPLQ
jgi:hypothetical protein